MLGPKETTHFEATGVLPNLFMGLVALVMTVFMFVFIASVFLGPALTPRTEADRQMRRIQNRLAGREEDENVRLRRVYLVAACVGMPFGLSVAWPNFTAAWDALWS